MSTISIGTFGKRKRTYATGMGRRRPAPQLRAAARAVQSVKKGELASITKRIVNQTEERKFRDTSATIAVDYNGNISDMTVVPQGVAQGQRVGDKIAMSMLELKMTVNLSILTGTSFRCVVFIHKQNSFNFAPTVISPLLPAGYNASNYATIFPYDIVNRKNYKILYDTGPIVPANSNTGSLIIKRNISLKNHKLRFNPAATTGTDKVWMLLYCDGAPANAAGVIYSNRLWYRDA